MDKIGENMHKVQILVSSYNGEKVIQRQIESILQQKEVEVHILIRDDGSKDTTVQILNSLRYRHPDRIEIVIGDNIGWKRSFIELLFLSGNYDYYGFSDQDDIWDRKKVIKSINKMEQDKNIGIKVCQCASICADENMYPLQEQEVIYDLPKSKKMAIAQEYFRGCCMLWNKEAMRLLRIHKPKETIAHDYWVGLVCYYFGTVYHCPEKLLYHIRYLHNSSTDGNISEGRAKRFKAFFSDKLIYMNPVEDLLNGYRELLTEEDIIFLSVVRSYKTSIWNKMKIVLDPNFRRENLKSTLFFKMIILLGKY